MRAIMKKSGNGASVRIPRAVLRATGFSSGQSVEVRAERGRIVIAHVGAHGYALDDLLARITPENRHADVTFGHPVGRERL
ncbi:AbrB/MazE/SpoVT family DNA-binding domain-containing protein [Profundibacterium mesophilum]|uniref:Transcriptional regulator AbrB n=1 Tax=Profundibacterium mesophilum KAUST100406-0324 TaxID=1037889 RepID=A0A921NU98_9RHOB|nr:AbrB/MazE/SpoVT family DNA-binding domain-containing protein [Profundibacterium mesophilum]KAF0674889.1 transcriptional regulator AbrB [Profundibacterium mesophilum KAUST100406-0324]